MLDWTDEQLVREVGRGRMEALAVLVRRHQQWALRLAYRTLGDWHLAEDVVQEAFLRVNRAAGRYRPEAKFGTWFHRIVVNLCMDELRKRPRQALPLKEAAAQDGSADGDPLRSQQIAEVQEAVRQALGQLNERERMVVLLHRFDGLSHQEIADVSEATVPAVESILVRAYRKLRLRLARFSENPEERPQGTRRMDV